MSREREQEGRKRRNRRERGEKWESKREKFANIAARKDKNSGHFLESLNSPGAAGPMPHRSGEGQGHA